MKDETQLLPLFLRSKGVTTDSRKIEKGTIFFALKGEKFDGNKFAKSALESGASYAVVSDANVCEDERFILVQDTLKALQNLANAYRRTFRIPVIGLTGSNGKTTSKELTAAVLSKKHKVHFTRGNLNNHIGVPLTLLEMPADTQIAVIEMGANKVGDIAELCQIAEPTHGYITNIGRAHIEGFGGVEGIIRGKSELYHHLILNDGTVFINSNEFILDNMSKRFKNPYKYGRAGDFFYAEFLEAKPYVKFRLGEQICEAKITGAHNFQNIITALCVGKFFEVTEKDALDAVLQYNPDNQRSQIVERGSILLLLDSYNANPDSMIAALKNLSNFDKPKKIALIGEMSELGTETVRMHASVLSAIVEEKIGIDEVICCGKVFEAAIQSNLPPNTPVRFFETDEKMKEHLQKTDFSNCAVLVKASRSQAYERFADCIGERTERAEA